MTTLVQKVQSLFHQHLESILEDIAAKHTLDATELKKAYLDLPPLASTEAPVTASALPSEECKKRGRKKKKQKDEYIEAEEYEYEGVKYLVDGNNNVYSYDLERPALIGERLVDGTVALH